MSFRSAFFILTLAMFLGCSKSQPAGPVVLGHLHPTREEDEIHGIALAVDAINADPSRQIAGRKLKVIHADAGNTTEGVQGQTVRLIAIDKVDGLIGLSRWSLVETMGQAAQAPMVPAVSLNGYIPSRKISCVFPVGIAPAEQGKGLARYCAEVLHGKNAIILKASDGFIPGSIADSFTEHFGKGGNRVVERSIEQESPEIWKEINDQKPDAIVLCGSAKQVLLWRSKLLAGPTLFFGGDEAELAELQGDVDPAKPLIAATSFHPDDSTPAAQEFVRQFREKYGKIPTTQAALAHDAVTVWVEAARRANSTEPARICDQLSKGETFEVLTGKLTFGPDHSPIRPIFVVKLAATGPALLKRFDP